VIIYLVQVILGLACMRGVFSSRIYVADSRRDSVSTYFGKRGVIGLLHSIDSLVVTCYMRVFDTNTSAGTYSAFRLLPTFRAGYPIGFTPYTFWVSW